MLGSRCSSGASMRSILLHAGRVCKLPRLAPSTTHIQCSATNVTSESPKPTKQQQSGKQKNQKQQKQSTSSAEDIRDLRINKAESLRQRGLEPYAYRFDRTHYTAELQAQYSGLENGQEEEGASVAVAGRIMARRVMGKLAFLSIRDDRGTIQVYVDKAKLEASQPGGFELLKNLTDVGDIIGTTGSLKRTEKGELSVVAGSLQVLTKSLLPLPDKWHGLADVEKRYRQRYVDMIVTEETRSTFRSRSKIISCIRRHLESQDFLEVETPVLESVAGGADARPFVTYHNTLARNFTLRIATELHLKRMVVGGFERVFELGRIFRNEGVSSRHNPEFTSVEVYQAYADYEDMMRLTEELLRECAQQVCGTLRVPYQDVELDFESPFRRVTMNDLVKEATGVDVLAFGSDVASAAAAARDALSNCTDVEDRRAVAAKVDAADSVGKVLNEMFEGVCEKSLIQPTFVLEHPVEISPLAKPHRSKQGVTERFELFIVGREHANAFSELTDPVEQRVRLEAQVAVHRAAVDAAKAGAAASSDGASSNGAVVNGSSKEGGEKREAEAEAEDAPYEVELDEDFLTALEYGMPPTAGLGIGVDRLVMLLTNSPSIRDVIAFPLMK